MYTLPIPPQLVPYLEHAIAASDAEYMFLGPDGGMRSKDNDLARLTQVVCKRAGLVEGYDHWAVPLWPSTCSLVRKWIRDASSPWPACIRSSRRTRRTCRTAGHR